MSNTSNEVPEWVRQRRSKSNWGVGIGISFCILGLALETQGADLAPAVMVCALTGVSFFIWGCSNYAMSKGRHWLWGILGFLNLPGLLLLMLIPRKKQALAKPDQKSPMERIAELQKMLGAGMLTEDEFHAQKQRILSEI